MIKFALRCDEGHEFESWFQLGAAFDAQAQAGLIRCPACGSASVSKAIMAPALARLSAEETRAAESQAKDSDGAAAPAPAPQGGPVLISAADANLRAVMDELRRHILENTDDLGDKFVEEAWRIHHGEAPDRAIRGQASADEARRLLEEGVLLTPLPRGPEDLN
ncbi:DUF1178 family protein [Methylocella sp.]|uniref:DUF1178 family protein n=1 Tax=Methylocella sp. TaxID=1978226 RepID=UPI003783818D